MNTIIKVQYLYRGEKIAEPQQAILEVGDRYWFKSPEITGFVPERLFVTGKTGINDVVYTVHYTKNGNA